jgi:hypothetical protein
MVAALPSIFAAGTKTILINKSWESGTLELALYSKDGSQKIKTLYQGPIIGGADGHAGFFIHEWNGMDPDTKKPYTGDYTIRWTFGAGYRDFPITIK